MVFKEGLPKEEIFEQRPTGSESFQAPRRASQEEESATVVFYGVFQKEQEGLGGQSRVSERANDSR